MKTLINFIENRYKMATERGCDPVVMFSQAFGALDFYHHEHPEAYPACEALWNECWRPKFEELIYG